MSERHEIQDTLEKYFHLTDFRPNQSEIIQAIIEGRDVLAVMATGGGKSLCYQLPAVMFPGMTVVISPLISLMKDQVDALSSQGVQVAMLNSSLSYDKRKKTEDDIKSGLIRILYVSPERAVQADFVELLQQTTVSLFAVDEAHCISMWGHQFRPEYRRIKGLRAFFPRIPFAAFTATATEQVREDIITELKMVNPAVFIGSFDRPNLHYAVCKEPYKQERMAKIAAFVKKRTDTAGIIYCFSRADTEELAQYLGKHRLTALPYHAGLSSRDRARIQEMFLSNEIRIICATIAFGMGIDKPDVRYVIHAHIPKDLESYYQETGRAGRDGLPSECLMFYSAGDRAKISHMMDADSSNNPVSLRGKHRRLNQLYAFCESQECRRWQILTYFGEQSRKTCGNCDICDQKKKRTKKNTASMVSSSSFPSDLKESIQFAIGELEGIFTVQDLISFLLGLERQKTKNLHLTRHKCFGCARTSNRHDLQHFIENMIAENLLRLEGNTIKHLFSATCNQS